MAKTKFVSKKSIILASTMCVALLGAAAYYQFEPVEKSSAKPLQSLNSSSDKGAYLALVGNCSSCHTTSDGKPYAGGVKFKTDFGTIYSTNITSDKKHGIGSWTFANFYDAMKHGQRPNGDFLYPAFPYISFAKMTDSDIGSLYLYFQSVPAVPQENLANEMKFPFSRRSLLYFWNRLFHSEQTMSVDTTKSAEWNRGAYLTEAVAHCSACHTPRNLLGGPKTDKNLQGGTYVDQVKNGNYRQWAAVDITSGPQGIAHWSKTDLSQYLLKGQNRHAIVHGPMVEVYRSSQNMTSSDAGAMATYIKDVPKSDGRVDLSFFRRGASHGEMVYTVHCGTCHLPDGKGDKILGVSLHNNPTIQAEDPSSLINTILYGPELPPAPFSSNRTTMKGFGKRLSDKDTAALTTYLRSSFNNNASQVSPADVNKQR